MDIEVKKPLSLKEYNKIYYEANKKKMVEQIKNSKNKREDSQDKIDSLLFKLNNNGFKRTPKKLLIKYNIIFDNDIKQFKI